MKILNTEQINNPSYWDTHQTNMQYGLREEKYNELVGDGSTICDLGCGLSPFLSQVNYEEKWGIDFSPHSIDQAKRMYPSVNYLKADVTNTGLPNDYFEAVVCGEVIEHITEPALLLKEMERICKKDGTIVLSTPILEIDEPEHLWEFSPEDFKGWQTEVVESERFKNRKYLFAWKRK